MSPLSSEIEVSKIYVIKRTNLEIEYHIQGELLPFHHYNFAFGLL